MTFLVLFAALTGLFIVITWPFAKAAFLAFTLAVIFFPLHKFILVKCHIPRYIAAVATTAVVGVCVIVPFAVLSGIVITKISQFLQTFASQIEIGTFSNTMQSFLSGLHDAITRLLGSAPTIDDLRGALLDTMKEAGRKFYDLSPRVLTTTVSIAANFILMLVFLIVFLAEGGRLYDWLMETAPISSDHRKELARDVRITITSSIAAAIVIAIVQGGLLGIGFWVAGFEQPYSWALVAMILALIPVVGAVSCYITATALLVSTGDIKGALMFFLYGAVVVSSIDNVVRPIVLRHSSQMHPLLLFVMIIGSAKLFGPIGLLVGPVLLSIFLASLRIYRREFAEIDIQS